MPATPTYEQVRAAVAAAREPAMRRFLADAGATAMPGETLERAVRRVQSDVVAAVRQAAKAASTRPAA